MKPKHKKAQYFSAKGLFANLCNFAELESKISELPQNERGNAFEVFAEAYFKTQPSVQANEVWPDKEIPQSIRNELGLPPTDMGIDGIFKTHDGAYHAYQVKYRSGRSGLNWNELSTFMGLSDKFGMRVLFSNSNDISFVMNARIDFYSIKGNDLDRLMQADFQAIEAWLKTGIVVRENKSFPRPYQSDAIRDILAEFEVNDRATAIMACGTGKTLIALWAAEQKNAETILVLLPSLALVRQTLHDWASQNSWDAFNYLCVCSDSTVVAGNYDETILHQYDLDFPVTTKKEDVKRYLGNQNISRKIIFSTYQSCQVVAEAMPEGFSFDLAIFDEAHKTASRQGANYAFALQDKNLAIKKRLFLTATPRHYNIAKKDKEGDQQLVFSMDDQAAYGRVVHKLSFRTAVQKELICDYKVIISTVTSDMITRELMSRGEVIVEGDVIKAQRIANLLAMQNAVDKFGVKRIFSFHNSVNSAESFTAETNEGIGAYLLGFTTLHVNGTMSTSKREALLKEFERAEKAIISNARCLTEGVNIPAVDMVAFVSPKKSQVDIVQAAGRVMRNAPGKNVGYILIPLFMQVAEDENIEQALQKTKFDTVWDVLQAMQEQDESLAEIISQMREDRGKSLGFNDNRLREKVEILGPEIGIDELRKAITTMLVDRLGSDWDERFGELVRYKEENGDCNVPQIYPANPSFAMWVGVQRREYKKGRLFQERCLRLNSLGFVWDAFDKLWEVRFSELCKFIELHGHCNVGVGKNKNKLLIHWVGVQRRGYKKGKLSRDKIYRLEEIGFIWDVKSALWEKMYAEFLFFIKTNNHDGVSGSKTLQYWIANQRANRRRGRLSQDRIQRLDAIGFIWDPYEVSWGKMYRELCKFVEINGHCNVSQSYRDKTLAIWISNQRADYKKSELSQHRIEKLNKIGFIWDFIDSKWENNFVALCKFKVEHGHCNVPQKYKENITLSHFVGALRKNYKENKLTQEQVVRLNDIGFVWDMLNNSWEESFLALCAFKEKNGHCNVPGEYFENPSLSSWVANQRSYLKGNKISQDRVEKLNSIGFIWNVLEARWESNFFELCEYKKKNGHCDVPIAFSALGSWIRTQRAAYRKNKISQDRISRLESLGFVWR